MSAARPAHIMHETVYRDRGDGRAPGQPSRGTAGLEPEAYSSSKWQGSLVPPVPSSSRGACCGEPVEGPPEDAWTDGRIRGRSRLILIKASSKGVIRWGLRS